MNQLCCLFLLALAATACRSPGSTLAPARDWDPLGSAPSPCGRYTLRLEHAEWRTDPGKGPRLSLQLALRTGEPDVLLCAQARVTDLVARDGAEFHEGGLRGYSHVNSQSGTLLFHELEVYEQDPNLRRLRIECRVLRVHSWRTYSLSWPESGWEEEVLCPPFHVGISGDEQAVRVGAWCGEDLSSFRAAERDLFAILGHDWVAASAALVDAADRPLACTGGSGTGGATVAFYGRAITGETSAPTALAFPVRGTLRLPERYTIEVVPFEFTDLPLVRPEGSPQVSAAAPDPCAEDRALEALLFPLSDQELFARGITSVDQPGWKAWSIAWTEDHGPGFEAVDRVLQSAEIQGCASCDLGMAGWYVPREDFFRARRVLLGDAEVVRLGVNVVTPRVGPE